jgi:hypothetical protein
VVAPAWAQDAAHHGRLGLTMLVTGALLLLVPFGIGLLVLGVVLRVRRAERGGGDPGPG